MLYLSEKKKVKNKRHWWLSTALYVKTKNLGCSVPAPHCRPLWAPVSHWSSLRPVKPPTLMALGSLHRLLILLAPGCSVLSLHLLFSTHLSDLNSSPLPWQELPMAPGPRQSGAHFTLLHSPSWHSSQFTIMCLCLWLMSVSPTELKGCTGRMRMCLIVTGSVAASPAPALCYLLNQYLRAEEGAMIRLHCHFFASDISKDDPPKCRAFLLNV